MDTSERRLKAYVHVARGEAGRDEGYVMFGPDDVVPEWAAEKIGEHCWADGTEEDRPEGQNLVATSWDSPLLPPSSTPQARPGHRPQTVPHGPGSDKGIAEAERRFGPPPGDAA